MKNKTIIDAIIHNNIQAQAEIFYSKNDLGVPDFEEVELVSRTEAYLEKLPPKQKTLLKTLFVVFEVFIPLAFLRFRPFSKLKSDIRVKIMKFLQKSKFYLVRSTFDSVKAVMAMMYLSHSDSLAHLGYYKPTRNPADKARKTTVKRGRLKSAARRAMKQMTLKKSPVKSRVA